MRNLRRSKVKKFLVKFSYFINDVFWLGPVARSDAGGHGFSPLVRQYSFVEIGHEIISTAIPSLPLIQVGQLSVTGKRKCTKYLLTA